MTAATTKRSSKSGKTQAAPAAPPDPLPPPGPSDPLAGGWRDAAAWLARWLAEGAASGAGPEMREFNGAVTALARLAALRDSMEKSQAHEAQDATQDATDDDDDVRLNELVDEGLIAVARRREQRGQGAPDRDALPD